MFLRRRLHRLMRNTVFVASVFFIFWFFATIQQTENGLQDDELLKPQLVIWKQPDSKKTGLFEDELTVLPYQGGEESDIVMLPKIATRNHLNQPVQSKMRLPETLFPRFESTTELGKQGGRDLYIQGDRNGPNLMNSENKTSESLMEEYVEYLHRQDTPLHIFVMHTHLGKHTTKFVIDYFQYCAGNYNNISWCENQPWERPPFLDPTCERPASTIDQTPLQIKVNFGTGQCQGIRMMYDYSLIDVALQGFRNEFELILVMQDPVQRVIDSYEMFPYRTQTSLKTFVEVLVNDRKFEKYTAHNLQTKQLAGVLNHCSLYSAYQKQEVENNLLNVAKANLAKYDAIFIVDKLEMSLDILQRKYKWRKSDNKVVSLTTEMITADRKIKDSLKISDKDREIIKQWHYLDIELYQYAVKTFMAQTSL